jgi:hypothetical protein
MSSFQYVIVPVCVLPLRERRDLPAVKYRGQWLLLVANVPSHSISVLNSGNSSPYTDAARRHLEYFRLVVIFCCRGGSMNASSTLGFRKTNSRRPHSILSVKELFDPFDRTSCYGYKTPGNLRSVPRRYLPYCGVDWCIRWMA